MKILAFSKNLAYGVGGAEISLHALMHECSQVNKFTIASVKGVNSFNAQNLAIENHGCESIWLHPNILMPRFFYNEYLVNRKAVQRFFSDKSNDYDELWAQNLWAPAAINSYKGRTVYFARDETFLNIRSNHHRGLSFYAKKLYNLLDSPGFLSYIKDHEAAVFKADRIVANSQYMSDQILKKFGRASDIILPTIDKINLRKKYSFVKDEVNESTKGVVLFGDTLVKGVEIGKRLASEMPAVNFYIFGRGVKSINKERNIFYMPWVKSPEEAFKYAKVVIAPSIWAEAYGRVAAESLALGIPCIVNNIGGLPEAVGYNDIYIGSDYFDMKKKLLGWLKYYDS